MVRFLFLFLFLFLLSSSSSSSLLLLLQSVIPVVSAHPNTNSHTDDIYQSYHHKTTKPKSIAIIGGGISGTFLTKYLVDYDWNCTILDTITIFEPNPVVGPMRKDETKHSTKTMHPQHPQHQSSRIATYEMEINIPIDTDTDTNTDTNTDATTTTATASNNTTKITIEIGASILYRGFHHVMEMIQQDPQQTLQIGVPYTTGNTYIDQQIQDPTSMGMYHGDGIWKLLLVTSLLPKYWWNYYLVLRYSWDLVTVSNICQSIQQQYNRLPYLFNQTHDYFMDSPRDIWESLQLYDPYITTSFDFYLDTRGISPYSTTGTSTSSTTTTTNIVSTIYRTIRNTITSLWFYLLPFQGSIRSELLTSINLANYNQNNTHINAVTGFGSFAAATGDHIFSIVGGNYQIITSAYQQAMYHRNRYCAAPVTDTANPESTKDRYNRTTSVQLITKRIMTVVGDVEGLALFAEDNQFVGEYDIVILAVPLQQSQIKFLIQSTVDPSIVQDMPLGGRINAHKIIDNKEDHEGHVQLPNPVPDSAIRPYTQVVTTIVRDVIVMNYTFFHLKDTSQLPRSILMTAQGQSTTYNITAITLIAKGIYKVFSNQPLELTIIHQIFGTSASIEYEHVWGGMYGGATPDYQAYQKDSSNTTNFLLYDGAFGLHGHTKSGALYYTNTMEQTALSCMEISAIGAKAVAKLIAERVGLLQERPRVVGSDLHDEL